MRTLSQGIKALLGSDHPVLAACAKYLFEQDGGKKIRPTMVLLVARAAAADEAARRRGGVAVNGQLPQPPVPGPLPSQRRLAEITEMIHTASLFHDDVIDEADERRGQPSINKLYGNKMAILAGDFLLARASVSLARLRNVEVVELLSTVIEHLVKGEVMQSRPQAGKLLEEGDGEPGEAALRYYLHKNYYKVRLFSRVNLVLTRDRPPPTHPHQLTCYTRTILHTDRLAHGQQLPRRRAAGGPRAAAAGAGLRVRATRGTGVPAGG